MAVRRRRGIRGFTLIELMIVCGTIGVLSSLAIPRFNAMFKKSRQVEAYQTLGSIERAMTEYYNRNSGYPATPAPPNPPGTGTAKRGWDGTVVAWNQISYVGDGAFRWQYEFYPLSSETGIGMDGSTTTYTCPPQGSCLVVRAFADTDNDGVVGVYKRVYVNGFRADRDDLNVED